MSWTSSELAALEKAYKEGVSEVQYEDKKVVYRNLAQMRSLIREARAEINGTSRSQNGSALGGRRVLLEYKGDG